MTGSWVRGRAALAVLAAGILVGPLLGVVPAVVAPLAVAKAAAAGNPCGPPVVSVIACENAQPGDPTGDWEVNGAGDPTIQGYATSMSVNKGQTVSFKVNTPASSYHFDIVRLGYYQGNGARKIATGLRPSATLPQNQPACLTDATTGLIDCGNWGASASWTVPTNAVSGVYLAHVIRDDTGGSSQIWFVVRDDSSHSDIIYQTSDTSWEAYNTYGGNSLYQCTVACPPGNPSGYKAAYKVSYNRPFTATDDVGRANPYYAEFPMIRFLEENGYDVSYTSGGDVDTHGSLLLNHKMFMSSGHDEYWSANQRANVQAARDAGVNLAFFSGNEMFWKTRWEPSTDGSNTPERTLVTYKETHFDGPVDPKDPPTWTGTWRDPRFSPPADGGQPENALTGQYFEVNSGTTDIQVPAADAKLRIWRNTAAANLTGTQTLTLGKGIGTLGYEWDVDADNGFRPPGVVDLSSTTVAVPQAFTDYGTNVGPATVTHHLTLYRAASGALVFGAGTVQWAWGLDNTNGLGLPPDVNMQQATVNLFADMGVQPATLLSGLVPATRSTDATAPTSTITAPTAGAKVSDGTAVTVTGTAVDSGGGVVAGVEVSTDGGGTWHPATGTTNWTYTWIAHGSPTATIKSRAVDDSGNLETPSSGITANVSCSCSIWGANVTPTTADSGDASSIEVGVKFKSDVFGTVTGIRFYKATANTGTHIGNLWNSAGQLLATATFTGETASGWQQVTFSQPVPIFANTTYLASYFAPSGHYSNDNDYFYPPPQPAGGPSMVDSPPLHALRSTSANPNGVFSYSGSTTFPISTDIGTNYWVDVSFTPASAPGPASNVVATAGYSSAGVTWTAPSTGGQATSYTVTPYIGTIAQPATTVTGTPAPTSTTVTGLTNGTAYTFTVTASNPAGTAAASTPSTAVTPSSTDSIVINGGFESGLAPWSSTGAGPPSVSTAHAHTGTHSALVGTASGADQGGDSSLSQSIVVPTGTSNLSFWYLPFTNDSLCTTVCNFDWQEAQLRTTGGTTLASVFKSNSDSQNWTQVTFDTTQYAGQTIVLWFNVHGDGSSTPDNTWMYVDDVSVIATGPPAAPAAPTAVSAIAGNAAAAVSWTAPGNGGSPITSYTVTPYIGSVAQTATTVTGAPPVSSANITGLTSGTAYTFKVTATNAVGSSPVSAASNSVTPNAPTAPSSPTGVTATAGNASASVVWTAPANGGSPITTYTVTPYIAGEGTAAQAPTMVTGSPPAPTASITGLSNGTAYTFTVTAGNAIGTSPASLQSPPVTPNPPPAPPAAPANVTATAGSQSATVNWTAPANGGSPITSYTVTPYIGTVAQTPTTVSGSPPATTANVIGLSNGTAYTFTVTATNAIGTGPASAASNSVTPVPPTAPAAPTGVVASPNDGWAAVSWTAPASGGSPITSYTVTPFVGTVAQTPTTVAGSPPPPTANMTGLTDGTSYTFTVTAANGVGSGPSSAPSNAVTPAGVPAAPTNVAGAAGNAAATVSWTAPANGGSGITSYVVTPYIGSVAQTATTVSGAPPVTIASITGLTNGTTYVFTVTAANAVGSGAVSAPSNTVTPTATGPSCPCTIFGSSSPAVADGGDAGQVNVGVKFTSDTNGFITGIRFYKASNNAGTHVGSLWTATGGLLESATFTNESASGWQQVAFPTPVAVTAGTTYVASYLAPTGHYSATSNAFGASGVNNPPLYALSNGVTLDGVYVYSSATTFPTNSFNATNYWVDAVFAVTAPTPPVAPTNVTATAGSNSATVTWTAPASGSSPITSYTVTPFIGSVAQTPTTVSGSPPATTANVVGLTNGTTYTFTVSATNGVGTGPASAASGPVTPIGPPAAPTGVTAAAGIGAATVSWTAPPNAGSPIASYTVTPFIGSAAQTATTVSGSPPATTATISGLTNGTAYTFTVSATNGAGSGPASAPSNIVTPTATAPNCPCTIFGSSTPAVADSGDTGSVNLGVKFMSDTNGFITGIRFYKASTNTGTHVGSLWSATGTLLGSATFSNETASGWQQVTFATPVAVTAGTTYVASYLAPSGHYSAAAAAFASSGVNSPPLYALASTTTADGVYLYGAANSFPTSSFNATNYWVDPVFSLTPPTAPAAPSGVTAAPLDGSATVTWTAPSSGGSPITSYTVTPFIGSVAQTATTVSGSPPATSATIAALTNGTAYTFTVTAINAIGTSPASAASNSVTPAGATAPAAPTGVAATAGNGSATVSWTAPANGRSPITGYTVTPFVGSVAQTPTTVSGSPPATNAAIAALTNGTAYTFTVTATNAIGTGPASAASNAITPAAPPAAPTGVAGAAGNAAATVSWTAPGNGGSAITGYTVTPFIGATAQTPTTVSGSPPATAATIAGLANGTTYTFTVSANNAAGTSPVSAPSNPVTPSASAPSCPCTIFGSSTPAVADSGDINSVNLGVKFTSDTNGLITGIRFYKASTNTGNHVGSLWSATGTLLGSATFVNETASGWQRVTFATPVAVTAGTTYVASYLAPNGHYSATSAAFASAGVSSPPLYALANGTSPDGVFSYNGAATFPTGTYNATNYWVDAVFDIGAPTAPAAPSGVAATAGNGSALVSWTAPADGRSPISSYAVTPFVGSVAQTPTTVSGAPPATNATVTGLTNGTAYTFTVTATNAVGTGPASAASGAVTPASPPAAPTAASGAAGNAAATVSWTAPANGGSAILGYTVTAFIGATAQSPTTVSGSPPATTATIAGLANGTTYTFTVSATNAAGTSPVSAPSNSVTPRASAPSCPCTIFGSSTPAVADSGDTGSVNLGVKFTSDSNGFITGIRFYKTSTNTGTHVGSLWSATGTLLGSATFSNETASGWQQVTFATPVAVTAGTTYVAAYLAPSGHYSVTSAAFASAGFNSPPLYALANGTSPNGVFAYNSANAFPASTFNATNYWVDAIFTP
jgi:Domain of unknown function (DUF4082)/Fibronectin type III domain